MLTTSDTTRVLSLYDLGKVFKVTPASRGFVNETAFVQTDRGRFVVRRGHRRLGEAAQRYRHRLIDWLTDHDLPTAELIPARNGDTLVTLDGRFCEVRTFVEGGDFTADRPLQAANVGATLARYHQIVKNFPPPEKLPPRYSPQTILGLTERLLERDFMGELYDWLSWYDLRAARLRQQLNARDYAALPHLVIHGDIHCDNLLFDGDEVAALLDYDQATWDARIVDVADGLIGFATASNYTDKLQWGVYQGPLDEEQAARLIKGYVEVEPLSRAEIEALPLLVEIIWLQGELGRVISTPEGSPDYHQDVLTQGRWLSTWMQERSQRIAAHWLDLTERAISEAHASMAA
jgi:homoserine kinase type II